MHRDDAFRSDRVRDEAAVRASSLRTRTGGTPGRSAEATAAGRSCRRRDRRRRRGAPVPSHRSGSRGAAPRRRDGLWRMRSTRTRAADVHALALARRGQHGEETRGGQRRCDAADALDDFRRRDEDRARIARQVRGHGLGAEVILVPVRDQDRVHVGIGRGRLRATRAPLPSSSRMGAMPSRIGASIRKRRPEAVTSIPEFAT